jgi:hypothetical protein
MKVIMTKSQYQKIVFNLLDVLYGPNISFKQDDNSDVFEILSNDGQEIFRLYTNEGRSKGCKRDLLVLQTAMEDIQSYVPPAVSRKKLFSKTIISYVNEKTDLDIDCIDFAYEIYDNDETYFEKKYRFNVKKNKKTTNR